MTMPTFRSALGLLAAIGTLASCAAPVAPVVDGSRATPMMTIDAARMLDTIASKPGVNWQDTGLTMPALQARRQALAGKYHTQALAGSVTKSLSLAAGASSSTPAYKHTYPDWPGPAPQATDRLYTVTDSGTMYALDATNLTVQASRAGLGTFSKTAVLVSYDGLNVYAVNTAGKLNILDATTLAPRPGSPISLSGTGFAKTAPYIDYTTSDVGGPSAHDDMVIVANDGTINRVIVSTPTGTAGAPTVWTPAACYGGAVSVSSFSIAWNQHVYVGTTTGRFYDVNLTSGTPSTRSWNLAANTSSTGTGVAIVAPASFDSLDGWNASALFVPCGDRLNWIDPVSGAVTPSLSLSVDKLTPTQSALSTYTPASTVTRTFTSSDYVSIKRVNSNPSRWGGSLGNVYNTGVQGTSVKYSTSGASGAPELWTANFNTNSVSRLNMAGAPIGSYGAPSANECDVDPNGYCWSSSGSLGGGNANRVLRYAPNGTQTFSVAVNNALWPAADSAGNAWVTTYTKAPGLVKLNSAGAQIDQASSTIPSAFSVAIDSTDRAWVTSYGNNRLYRVASNGTVQGFTNVGSTPAYVAIDPLTGNAWTANNGAGTVSVVSPTGTLLNTFSVPANVWAIKFDATGAPWTCHLSPTSQVNELNRNTGAVVSTYNMSAFGNCYEMTFDGQGNGWVATDGGIIELLALGNLTDLFASTYYAAPADTDDSYGFVKFKIPVNNYTGFAPVSANFKLTANSTPATTETFDVFKASPTNPGGALWTGYPGAPNVDYNNRPAVTTPAIAGSTGLTVVKDSAYTWGVPTFGDQVNSPDGANAQYAYAFRSSGKKLGDVAHWYSNTSAGGTTARYPTLSVTLANTAKLPAAGIACQAAVNINSKVYISACNAMWELDYSSPANFQSPAKTIYNLGQLGRSGTGPITATPKTYVYQTTNVLQTYNNRLVMAELNPANNQLNLANYTNPLSAAADRLGYQVNVTPAKTGIGQQLLYDFVGGSVYLTSANGYVIRANILQ